MNRNIVFWLSLCAFQVNTYSRGNVASWSLQKFCRYSEGSFTSFHWNFISSFFGRKISFPLFRLYSHFSLPLLIHESLFPIPDPKIGAHKSVGLSEFFCCKSAHSEHLTNWLSFSWLVYKIWNKNVDISCQA